MAKTAAVSEVRAWAKANGYDIGDRGRLPVEVWDAWTAAAKPKASKRSDRATPAALLTPASGQDSTELKHAQERLSELEARLEELTARLEKVETAAAASPATPKRRFARSR